MGAKTSLWNHKVDLPFALYDIKKEDLLTSDLINGVRVQSQIGAEVPQGAELAASVTPEWLECRSESRKDLGGRVRSFFENFGTGVVSRAGKTSTGIPEWITAELTVKYAF